MQRLYEFLFKKTLFVKKTLLTFLNFKVSCKSKNSYILEQKCLIEYLGEDFWKTIVTFEISTAEFAWLQISWKNKIP